MNKWCILGRGIKVKSHKTSGALNKGYMRVNIPVEMNYAAIFSLKHKEKVETSTANTQLYIPQ
jgi:hypothetical protein